MGIPYAFHYYYNKYNCEKELMIDKNKLKTLDTSHLFFDYNSLIHPCAYKILEENKEVYLQIYDIKERTEIIENDIIDNCLTYTLNLIDLTNCFNIYIVIDGVAPRSKMNQQRERRYKSEFFKSKEDINLWDSNKITPGTNFMKKLKSKLDIFKLNQVKNIIISDSNEKGEGEHKIMSIITRLNINSKCLIYGLDADLIMLSLINKNFNNIILIRDNSFSKIKNANGEIDYLDIKNLKVYISKDIINSLYAKNIKCKINQDNLIYDYIVLCFLLGNDFLDSLPSLSIRKKGIDTIINAYTNSWKDKYLVDKLKMNDILHFKECINLNLLKDIMYQLKNHESYFFKNFKVDNLVDSIEEINNVSFYNNDLIDFKTENYKKRYYIYNSINQVNQLNDVCQNYIEGLHWILGYYNNHIHKNWSWYYKYHSTPLCSDIFEYLNDSLNKKNIRNYLDTTDNLIESNEYSCVKQLCMVLPKKSLYSILSEINYPNIKMLNDTIFSDLKYYPKELYIDVFNKRYLWQSKILFYDFDENILDLFIN